MNLRYGAHDCQMRLHASVSARPGPLSAMLLFASSSLVLLIPSLLTDRPADCRDAAFAPAIVISRQDEPLLRLLQVQRMKGLSSLSNNPTRTVSQTSPTSASFKCPGVLLLADVKILTNCIVKLSLTAAMGMGVGLSK